MKDAILNTLTMDQVLEKYGFKLKKGFFNCPFHGVDKHPSAKSYNISFYCFACGKGGDLIKFVKDYFGLGFKETLEKLNLDFGLGFAEQKIDKEHLEEIKRKHNYELKQKQLFEQEKNRKLLELCDKSIKIQKEIKILEKDIKPYYWEEPVYKITIKKEELEKIDDIFENLLNREYKKS